MHVVPHDLSLSTACQIKADCQKSLQNNCFSLQKLDSMSGVFVDKTKTETNRISNDYNKYIFSCKHKIKT